MMDTLVNIYPTLVVYCVVLSTISAVIACVTAWWLFKPDALTKRGRDTEVDKQIAKLETAMQIKHRCDLRMSRNCHRLEKRVKQLEKENKRVK